MFDIQFSRNGEHFNQSVLHKSSKSAIIIFVRFKTSNQVKFLYIFQSRHFNVEKPNYYFLFYFFNENKFNSIPPPKENKIKAKYTKACKL